MPPEKKGGESSLIKLWYYSRRLENPDQVAHSRVYGFVWKLTDNFLAEPVPRLQGQPLAKWQVPRKRRLKRTPEWWKLSNFPQQWKVILAFTHRIKFGRRGGISRMPRNQKLLNSMNLMGAAGLHESPFGVTFRMSAHRANTRTTSQTMLLGRKLFLRPCKARPDRHIARWGPASGASLPVASSSALRGTLRRMRFRWARRSF